MHKMQRFDTLGITNNSRILLDVDIPGGGKRAKVADEIPTIMFKPDVKEQDIDFVKAANATTQFDFKAFVMSLSVAELEDNKPNIQTLKNKS